MVGVGAASLLGRCVVMEISIYAPGISELFRIDRSLDFAVTSIGGSLLK